jgi:hypothetical protein
MEHEETKIHWCNFTCTTSSNITCIWKTETQTRVTSTDSTTSNRRQRAAQSTQYSLGTKTAPRKPALYQQNPKWQVAECGRVFYWSKVGCCLEDYRAHVASWAVRNTWRTAQGRVSNGKSISNIGNMLLCAATLVVLLVIGRVEQNPGPGVEDGNCLQVLCSGCVNLISVVCKQMEHVIASYLRKIWDKMDWLFDGQHGFRPGYSCESQVITVYQDIADSLDNGSRPSI